MLIAPLADGRLLVEEVPGLPKTRAIEVLSRYSKANFVASNSLTACSGPTSPGPTSFVSRMVAYLFSAARSSII